MARIRTIKPDFFLHEDMAALIPLDRLLFIGLWTLADRDGRMEDRPRRIKASIFPYDDGVDVGAVLSRLATAGFVVRYEADGVPCLAIPSFLKHQRPHPKETSFNLPSPPGPGKKTASREKKRQEIKVQPAIPSSTGGVGNGVGNGLFDSGDGDGGKPATPADLQNFWNELRAPEMPRWAEMPDGRKASAKARLVDRPRLEDWRKIIQRLAASSFARGLVSGKDGKTWIAGPDFLLQPDAATKILEGKYDDRQKTGPAPPPVTPCAVCANPAFGQSWGQWFCATCQAEWVQLGLTGADKALAWAEGQKRGAE